jgi:hypothetical protein
VFFGIGDNLFEVRSFDAFVPVYFEAVGLDIVEVASVEVGLGVPD